MSRTNQIDAFAEQRYQAGLAEGRAHLDEVLSAAKQALAYPYLPKFIKDHLRAAIAKAEGKA